MAFDFSAIKTEIFNRGLTDLNDGGTGAARVARWANDAMHKINDLADWPYLLTSTTKSSFPAQITDLRTIEAVTNTSEQFTLQPSTRRQLREGFANLTTSGTAAYYYFTAADTIDIYPSQSGVTLTIDYWKAEADMSANGDTPLMPDRFRMAIVHYAVADAREDRGDMAGAQSARAQGDEIVQRMALALLPPQHQAADTFAPVVGDDI